MGGIRKHKHRKPKQDRDQYPPGGYKDIVRENAAFETFYKAQDGLCPKGEFEQMIKSFKTDLPASFRVTGFRSQAFAVRDLIEGTYFTALTKVAPKVEEGCDANGAPEEPIPPPRAMQWYPDRLAWQLSITRKDIRRVEAYYRLHNFLVSETESGS
jgi:tRNA (cytosine34-C5)-methyltransferase